MNLGAGEVCDGFLYGLRKEVDVRARGTSLMKSVGAPWYGPTRARVPVLPPPRAETDEDKIAAAANSLRAIMGDRSAPDAKADSARV
jgi:hypothetical protein